MSLHAEMIEISQLTREQIQTMFTLMDTFYDHIIYSNFIKDLEEKDYCILLFDEINEVRGFSTQKILTVFLDGKAIHGVFSGDTIIHKDYWGSMELYKVFAQSFIKLSKQYDAFYWFLISKGYKTYKMLPLFYKSFYPTYEVPTPVNEKSIMDAFGLMRYPGEYNPETGVIEYKSVKDKLKDGIADITEKQLKDEHIRFFVGTNPNYVKGNDLVCLARLHEANLTTTARRLFMGE